MNRVKRIGILAFSLLFWACRSRPVPAPEAAPPAPPNERDAAGRGAAESGGGPDAAQDGQAETPADGSAEEPAPDPAGTGTAVAEAEGAGDTGASDQTWGLYVDDVFQAALHAHDALAWITANAKSGVRYTIVLGKDQAIPPAELAYGRKKVRITLKSLDEKRTVTFEGKNPSRSLFTVGSGITFVLEDGVTLKGAQNDADKSIVRVVGGAFIMNGGELTGNKTSGYGGGVRVDSGEFTMNGGSISGNATSKYNGSGGGVYVGSGVFVMNGGAVSGNTASGTSYSGGGGVYVSGEFSMNGGNISGNTASSFSGDGGGVYVSGVFTMSGGNISGNAAGIGGGGGGVYVSGVFTMSGGSISGNTASYGGGVYMAQDCTFVKSGGIIYGSNAPEEAQANKARDNRRGHAVSINGEKKRNTTAQAAAAMDSGKDGPAGGWE